MKKKTIKFEKDFLDFLELCNKYEVRYLVIGGYAVGFHGYVRNTKDIDINIDRTEINAEKLLLVLDEFGFGSLNMTKDDFLKKDFFTQFGYEPDRIDIINYSDDEEFDNVWLRRKIVDVQGVEINFIGLDDLIKLKAKAGRKQDIADIEKLRKRNNK